MLLNLIEKLYDINYIGFEYLDKFCPIYKSSPRKSADLKRGFSDKEHMVMGEKLPTFLRPFFWDVDFRMLSIAKSAYFIISRLMEHGDEAAMFFLLKTYSRKEMINVLKKSRSLSRRSRNFWRIFFDLKGGTWTPKRYPTPYGIYSKD